MEWKSLFGFGFMNYIWCCSDVVFKKCDTSPTDGFFDVDVDVMCFVVFVRSNSMKEFISLEMDKCFRISFQFLSIIFIIF